MATTWFTSDLHLGHPFIAELRGFAEVEEHDRVILDNLAKSLNSGDELWVLGDISSGWEPQEERALNQLAELFAQFRGGADPLRAYLISGNHDSSHPLHEWAYTRQPRFLEVFDAVQERQVMHWQDPQGEDREVWLSHFPRPGYEHAGMESRFDELRLNVPYLLHGHLHSSAPVTAPGQVDMGVEAWGLAPVEQAEVMATLWESTRKKAG